MDDEQEKKLSYAELAKKRRKEAYRAAKEKQKTDPKYLAMKEQMREKRRAEYQRQKAYIKSQKEKQDAPKSEFTVPKDPSANVSGNSTSIDSLRSKLRIIQGGKQSN